MNRGARLRLDPAVHVVPAGPDAAKLRRAGSAGPALWLEDPNASGRLGRILDDLRRGTTLGRLRRALPGHDRLVRDALRALRGAGFLAANDRPPGRKAAAVHVVGVGRIAGHLAEALTSQGVRVLLTDPDAPNPSHRLRSILDRCRRSGAAAPARAGPPLARLTSSAPGPSRLWVLALDALDPTLCARVDEAARHGGRPWLLVAFDGAEGIVGPWFDSPRTGCFTCYRLRLRANLAEPERLAPFWAHLASRGGQATTRAALPAWLALVLAGWAARRAADGQNPAALNVQWSVDLSEGMVRSEPFLKLPRCPSCGPIAGGRPPRQALGPLAALLEPPAAGRRPGRP